MISLPGDGAEHSWFHPCSLALVFSSCKGPLIRRVGCTHRSGSGWNNIRTFRCVFNFQMLPKVADSKAGVLGYNLEILEFSEILKVSV